MITSIIFSKDRPLQLDLTLKSVYKNFSQSTSNIVIYDCSPEFDASYVKLKEEHPHVQWWKQGRSLFKDVWVAIGSSDDDLVCFFTDDGIMFSESPEIHPDIFNNGPHVACFSLRMGINIDSRSHKGESFPDLPQKDLEILQDKWLIWRRSLPSYGSYWSYSLSLDGHIFRKEEIFDMVGELVYLQGYKEFKQNPNKLEEALQRFWAVGSQQCMVSHKNSVYVNSPNNRVSDSCLDNMSGEKHSYSSEKLLQFFTEGKRINLDLLDSAALSQIRCPHTEIDLMRGMI